jgi:hypothetical protein
MVLRKGVYVQGFLAQLAFHGALLIVIGIDAPNLTDN